MEKLLTPLEAWGTFWPWIRSQPEWAQLSRQQRQYLYKAVKAAREGNLGAARIKSLLTKYAPERYEFRETVILKQQ